MCQWKGETADVSINAKEYQRTPGTRGLGGPPVPAQATFSNAYQRSKEGSAKFASSPILHRPGSPDATSAGTNPQIVGRKHTETERQTEKREWETHTQTPTHTHTHTHTHTLTVIQQRRAAQGHAGRPVLEITDGGTTFGETHPNQHRPCRPEAGIPCCFPRLCLGFHHHGRPFATPGIRRRSLPPRGEVRP